jgi:hypothetical protein
LWGEGERINKKLQRREREEVTMAALLVVRSWVD